MKKVIKRVIWIVLLIGLFAFIGLQFRPQPVEVDTTFVGAGPLAVTINETGQTVVRKPFIISAPLAGKLRRVTLKPGDLIARDSVLACIKAADPGLLDARTEAEAVARVNTAQAAIKRREQELAIQQAESERQSRYVTRDEGRLKKGFISAPMLVDREHDARIAQGNVEVAKAAVEVSRYELEQARAALVHLQSQGGAKPPGVFEIRSPIDGIVVRRFQESGKAITPGEQILEIGNLQDLEVRIEVLSQDAVKIKPGQPVLIEHWGGDKVLNAYITRVEPAAFTKVSALGVDEQRVYIYADLSATDPRLGDSYHVEARIVIWEKENVVKVPAGALFRNGKQWAVYVVSPEGEAALKIVKIGQHNGIEAEVLDGLKPGDKVVLHPGDRIENGTQILERQQND